MSNSKEIERAMFAAKILINIGMLNTSPYKNKLIKITQYERDLIYLNLLLQYDLKHQGIETYD